MASVAIVLMHQRGHALDFLFCLDKLPGGGGASSWEVSHSLMTLSWTDHYLLDFRQAGPQWGGSGCSYPGRRMDVDGFLIALGDYLSSMLGDSVPALS